MTCQGVTNSCNVVATGYLFFRRSELRVNHSEPLSVFPMAVNPDPASPSWLPMTGYPMRMRSWRSRPMAGNPNPFPPSIGPMARPPNCIWIRGRSINFHPWLRWSNSDHRGRTSQKENRNGANDNQRGDDSDLPVHHSPPFSYGFLYDFRLCCKKKIQNEIHIPLTPSFS